MKELRGLFDAAPDGIVVVNEELRIVRVNPAAERLFDYTRDELLNRPLLDLIPERSVRRISSTRHNTWSTRASVLWAARPLRSTGVGRTGPNSLPR